MVKNKEINYWLFQSSIKNLRLKDALRMDNLSFFPVKNFQKKIQPGDKVILWQTGKQAGCYALAEVKSTVGDWKRSKEEKNFFTQKKENGPGVKLKIEYNLWDNPLTKDILPKGKTFTIFHNKRSGTNSKATASQYKALKDLVQQNDMVHEPEIPYLPQRSIDYPMNLVLYGPPGTGKTYHTLNYALAIIENRTLEELALENRLALQQRFAHYSEQGLIYFVTFHQAFSYEDFVEGIKPVTKGKKVVYEIQNGIFKHISLEAKRNMVETLIQHAPQHQVHIEFNALYNAFLEYLKSDDFNSFTMATGAQVYLHRIERYGNLSLRKEKSFSTTKVLKRHLKKIHRIFPDIAAIQNLDRDLGAIDKDIKVSFAWAIFNELKKFEPQFVQSLLEEAQNNKVEDKQIQEFDMHDLSSIAMQHSQKFVLIIDEINRGNIASIFGDLITLIEPDKREGGQEALRLILPYSKTVFCVPPNLHIIGTMNTADRSVEAMDIALRRRFTFVEMKPDPAVIKKEIGKPLPNGIDLEKLLTAINDRISVLLDKDFCIGHSYFLKVKNMADLQRVFDIEIIPLLQEYFFGDYGKIGLVLGKDFVVEKKKNQSDIFANFDHEYKGELSDQAVYDIKPVEELDAGAFIRVYDKSYE